MTTSPEPIVVLEHMQRQLQGQTVLNNINARIYPGDVVGLVGKNGAGKTTLLETILGFSFPAFGEAQLWGDQATALSGEHKQRIGFVPQRDELLPMMNGEDHIKLYRSLRGHWNQDLVDTLCREWDILLRRPARKMSVGERQKLSIVLALAHEPDLLILDEPVASLDPLARRQFLQQLVEVAADTQRAIVFSSHIMTDLERVANHVWLLHNKELAWDGGLDELKESVVRVSFSTDQPLPQRPSIDGLLVFESQPHSTWLICRDWSPQKARALAEQVGVELQVDYLGLEDIFLYFDNAGRDL